jgi:hypothetical protein
VWFVCLLRFNPLQKAQQQQQQQQQQQNLNECCLFWSPVLGWRWSVRSILQVAAVAATGTVMQLIKGSAAHSGTV